MLVYRDGKHCASPLTLALALHDACARAENCGARNNQEPLLEALLRAGELESALADSPGVSTHAQEIASQITDALAAALAHSFLVVCRASIPAAVQLAEQLSGCDLPEKVCYSAQEGFAYYALHPRSYVEAAREAFARDRESAVIGIRSIGTTLSAVVFAALTANGAAAARITLRPTGHPFDRSLEFTFAQRAFVQRARGRNAQFLIVDEGPGMSGSSLLSVATELEECGVRERDILFICSRDADAGSLCARDAAARWPRYKKIVARSCVRPPEADRWLGGGEWRKHFIGDEEKEDRTRDWPPVWPQTERNKFLSRDQRVLYKFEGFGHYGRKVHERARLLAQVGFAPPMSGKNAQGYIGYKILGARPATEESLHKHLLLRMAEYCAFRVREFHGESPEAAKSTQTLAEMAAVNAREAFGIDVDLSRELTLERPVIADARMMPHEWLIGNDGAIYKCDAVSHGDDHFYPGPCDIAWDVAGAIVEWQMNADAQEFFLSNYRRLSGDKVTLRLPHYILAYSLFRLGFCYMAAEAMKGSAEEIRFRSAEHRYRQIALRQLNLEVPQCA